MRTATTLAVLLAFTASAHADGHHRKHKKAAPKKQEPKQEEPAPEIDLDPPAPAPPPTLPAPQAVDEDPLSRGPSPEARGPDAGGSESAEVHASAIPRSRHHARLYVRAGVAHVHPFASSKEMELADISGAASLAVMNGPIAGSGATVSSATIPALIVGYQLPWLGGHLALETVLGVPFTVKFQATGTLANESIAPMALGIPTGVKPLGPELGEAKAAPPTITAVYDFAPRGRVHPFLGAGAAVMFAFGAKVTNPTLIEVSQPDFKISPAPGFVLQTGIDANLGHRIHARLDLKYIAFLQAHGEVHHVQVRTPELLLFDTVEVGTAKMNVTVNPLIIQAGIGTDF
jgi:outer membrane protein